MGSLIKDASFQFPFAQSKLSIESFEKHKQDFCLEGKSWNQPEVHQHKHHHSVSNPSLFCSSERIFLLKMTRHTWQKLWTHTSDLTFFLSFSWLFLTNEKLFIVLFKLKRLASLIGENLIFSSNVDKTKQGTWKHLQMRIAAVIKNGRDYLIWVQTQYVFNGNQIQ